MFLYSWAASKHEQPFIHSSGDIIPPLFLSGEKSRCPFMTAFGYWALNSPRSLSRAFFCSRLPYLTPKYNIWLFGLFVRGKLRCTQPGSFFVPYSQIN